MIGIHLYLNQQCCLPGSALAGGWSRVSNQGTPKNPEIHLRKYTPLTFDKCTRDISSSVIHHGWINDINITGQTKGKGKKKLFNTAHTLLTKTLPSRLIKYTNVKQSNIKL